MREGIWIQSQGRKILAFVDIVEFVVYPTEERTLEVLKEIQESIIEKKKLYEMPKE